MTIERSWFVLIPRDAEPYVRDLADRAYACVPRADSADPGDRTHALRFETLQAALDQLSAAALASGADAVTHEPVELGVPSLLTGSTALDASSLPARVREWVSAGRLVTQLRLSHSPGALAENQTEGRGPLPVASRWHAGKSDVRDATRERFDTLLAAALAGSTRDGAIRPSDVSNVVLTETLRKAVVIQPGRQSVELPVRYRDGSEGPPFPLRVLDLIAASLPEGWSELRFTLMSIRHVEMDSLVDGAWFRNSRLSRPRPAGYTDELAFEISTTQLKKLMQGPPIVIHMYQTGLEPAVVGFYRAVVRTLMAHSKRLAVVPHFYEGEGRFAVGTLWRQP